MTDTLEIFDDIFTGVTGIKATDSNDQVKIYIRPQGTKSISANGTGIDVAEYASVDVSVSGGVDMPIFTINYDSIGDLDEITCNKTFSEIVQWVFYNNYCAPAVSHFYEGVEFYDTFAVHLEFDDPDNPSSATFYINALYGPIYKFVYYANGTIVAEPFDYYEYPTFTQNGEYYPSDGKVFGIVTVNVPSGTPTLQNKTVSPSESQQSVQADSGYDGLDTVTVNAISSTYVGSGITRRSSTDLTASGATVTVPSGYYSSQASKAVSNGSATPAATISGTSSTITTGTNTLTLSKTISNTPQVTAGYISSGTAGNSSVSLTASITTKAAATITPGTTNQTIASGTYLTGTQTIAGDADLVASNIVSGVQIFGVTGNVVLQNYYTGSSAPSSSLGANGDLYLQS